jgi:hypothetical protein
MTIKPIETVYKGYRFRSRLEARWAVFFDACGYKWEYEPEGFDLGDGIYYLPDFKIFGKDDNGDTNVFWVEVKPSEGGLSDPKVESFQEAIRNNDNGEPCVGYGDFIILDGPPDHKLYYGTLEYAGGGRQWLMEPLYRGRPSFWDCDGYDEVMALCGAVQVGQSAVEKALSARFEHGETPNPESFWRS